MGMANGFLVFLWFCCSFFFLPCSCILSLTLRECKEYGSPEFRRYDVRGCF